MKRILEKCDCSRGAQMGRRNNIPGDIATAGKLHLIRMKMVDGDYDQGCVYWGGGNPEIGYMYWCYGETATEQIDVFVRAKSRGEAKEEVKDTLDTDDVIFHRCIGERNGG